MSPFCYQIRPYTTKRLRSVKAFRVLDAIARKENITDNLSRQRYLRLVRTFYEQLLVDSLANVLLVIVLLQVELGFHTLLLSLIITVLETIYLLSIQWRFQFVCSFSCRKKGMIADPSVLSQALNLSGSNRTLNLGTQVHCLVVKTGFIANVYVGSSLITLYSRCGLLDNAYRVFDEMTVRNIVSWTAIITGFAQESQADICLDLYHRMRQSMFKPNDITLTSFLSACTSNGSLMQGRIAHCHAIHMGFVSHVHIANSLMSMYSKCGNIKDAFYIFENMHNKDLVSWNSMINGYSQHGLALLAIHLFEEMKQQRIKPDAITFLGILSSCRHAGIVKEGWLYFNSMQEYGVEPELDHYSCIVDLLGRAGCIQDAFDFINTMPLNPNALIWGSLLSSCRLYGNVWMGIEAAEKRLVLRPRCGATYLQLANLYASGGYWDQAARLRKMIKDKGLKNDSGSSWIEIKNGIYRFRAEEKSNTQVKSILGLMNGLVDHMRGLVYVPEI